MSEKTSDSAVQSAYQHAQNAYAEYGVDTNAAIQKLRTIPISLHCWQGDDVAGLENIQAASGGGIQATGNYPGKARNGDELRADIETALKLIPGAHRVNIHAMYAETGGKKIDRNQVEPAHFRTWIEWAKQHKLGMDFNPSLFAHPKADSGFTLSSRDEGIRRFWIEHCQACRKIGEAIGRALASPCVNNIWIPDGIKDTPVDRLGPRAILRQSLDQILAEKIDPKFNLDAVESKLFGIGSESYVVGSHEFYLGYAIENNVLLTLDSGHFHPTENIADKISSLLLYLDQLLLHVSRGIRWDSDHVVILNDDLMAIAGEIVRNQAFDRIHIGLDYFDASINRIAAWVTGTRAMTKALLVALLEPFAMLRNLEKSGDYTGRLALLEEVKALPWTAVWDYYCLAMDVPVGAAWLPAVREYEKKVLSKRI